MEHKLPHFQHVEYLILTVFRRTPRWLKVLRKGNVWTLLNTHATHFATSQHCEHVDSRDDMLQHPRVPARYRAFTTSEFSIGANICCERRTLVARGQSVSATNEEHAKPKNWRKQKQVCVFV